MSRNPLRWIWDAFLGPADDGAPKDDREPVFLAGPYYEVEAEMLKSKLDAMGIPAFLRDRSPYPRTIRLGTTTCDLWVRYRDLEAAREALGIEDAQ